VELENGNGILLIDKHASVKGNITCSNLVLAGKVVGNVVASGTVEVCSGATIRGDIESERLHVDPNARINGRLSSLNGDQLKQALGNMVPKI
jgi:cytoskeletal protein CcmA (bactofilin family)